MGRLQIFCLLAPLVVGEDDGAVVEKRNVHHTSQHGHTHIQFGNSGVHHVAAPVALVPHHQVHHVSSSSLVRVPQHHAHHLNLGAGVPTVLAGLRNTYNSAASEATPAAQEETVDVSLNARQGKQAEADGENLERVPTMIEDDQTESAASPESKEGESFGKQEDREGKQLLILPPTPTPQPTPAAKPECKMLQCDSVDGPIDDPADCPSGEKEICVETLETECKTVTNQQCQDYQETECVVSPKEVCITADQTTCTDTEFQTSCTETKEECQSVETQKCGDPTPEEVCAEITQVSCEPEEITLCKTTVSVEVSEECIEVQETHCKDNYDQVCYIGFAPGECENKQVEECKYVNVPCEGYKCQPQTQKVCNYVSKTNCHYAHPQPRCKGLPSQKCHNEVSKQCISVPKVVPDEVCETKTVNNCKELPTKECLTTYKTTCEAPEEQDVCFDISAPCEGTTLTNRVCEGQNQPICFEVKETTCSKVTKQLCTDIPSVTCEKVPSKKCFTVPTPPKLTVVPTPCPLTSLPPPAPIVFGPPIPIATGARLFG